MRQLACILCGLCMAIASPLLALGTSLATERDALVLVVSTPFGPPIEQIVAHNNLIEVYPNRAPFGAFVSLSGPEDVAKLRTYGPVLLLSGERMLALCA